VVLRAWPLEDALGDPLLRESPRPAGPVASRSRRMQARGPTLITSLLP